MRSPSILSALVVWSCSGCGAAPARPPVEAPIEAPSANGNGPTEPAAVRRALRVSFTEVVSTPGCFFFSGPAPLGVRDTLGTEAELTELGAVQLAFGTNVLFWSLGGDGVVQLARESHHEYGGLWTVLEQIVVEPVGDGYRGRYHYDELPSGSATPGNCHIDAVVTMTPL